MTRHLLLSLFATLTLTTTAASPALACGMYEEPVRGTPVERIATAKEYLKQGDTYLAARYARTVALNEKLPAAIRAEAYTLAGIVRWKQGAKEMALENFRMAKKLDAQKVETVLVASAAGEKDAIKKALEA